MTLKECIDFVNTVKPDHAFPEAILTEWINDVEGYVQTEIFCFDPTTNLTRYNWDDNKNTELLVKPPHDEIYRYYLYAMIDFHNGEYDKAQNSFALYNEKLATFNNWFIETYHPGDIPCGGCHEG